MRLIVPTAKRLTIPTDKRMIVKHSHLPPITHGLRFVPPLRKDAKVIYNAGGGVDALAPSVESVDAVGTYRDPITGLITQAQANVLRIEKAGGLFNGPRTNVILQARQMGTTWTPVSGLTRAQDAIGVDGVANAAWTLTDDSVLAEHLRQTVTVANDSTTWAISIYVRKDSTTDRFPAIACILFNGTSQTATFRINTSTGETFEESSVGTVSVAVKEAGDFWRMIVTVANNSSGNTQLQINIFPARSVTLDGAKDDTTQGSFVIDAVQVENATFASSFIDTTTAPVTRALDIVDYSKTGNLVNGTPYTIFVGLTPGFDSTETFFQGFLDTTNIPSNWGVRLSYSAAGTIQCRVRDATSTQVNLQGAVSFSKGDTLVVATTGATDDFNLYSDGALIAGPDTSGSLPTAHNAIHLGSLIALTNPWFGNIAYPLIYNRALIAAEVTILTDWIKRKMGL